MRPWFVGLLLLGACASASGNRKEEGIRLDHQLDEERALAAPGAAPTSRFSAEVERGSEEHAFRVMLREGSCYATQVALSAGIKQAEVTVFGPTGTRLGNAQLAGPRLYVEVCTTLSGPHRGVLDAPGRGPLRAAVYEEPKPPTPAPRGKLRLPGFGRPAATSTATGSGTSAAPTASGTGTAPAPTSTGTTSAPGPMVCSAVGAAATFARLVRGEDRACAVDADCISVKADCSHLACTGVHISQREKYQKPIDCRGYTGVMGNYDCDPQFGIEAPKCRAGCCVSERVQAFAPK